MNRPPVPPPTTVVRVATARQEEQQREQTEGLGLVGPGQGSVAGADREGLTVEDLVRHDDQGAQDHPGAHHAHDRTQSFGGVLGPPHPPREGAGPQAGDHADQRGAEQVEALQRRGRAQERHRLIADQRPRDQEPGGGRHQGGEQGVAGHIAPVGRLEGEHHAGGGRLEDGGHAGRRPGHQQGARLVAREPAAQPRLERGADGRSGIDRRALQTQTSSQADRGDAGDQLAGQLADRQDRDSDRGTL